MLFWSVWHAAVSLKTVIAARPSPASVRPMFTEHRAPEGSSPQKLHKAGGGGETDWTSADLFWTGCVADHRRDVLMKNSPQQRSGVEGGEVNYLRHPLQDEENGGGTKALVIRSALETRTLKECLQFLLNTFIALYISRREALIFTHSCKPQEPPASKLLEKQMASWLRLHAPHPPSLLPSASTSWTNFSLHWSLPPLTDD